MVKYLKTKIILAILILISAIDIFTALAVKYKQPFFNESNPIYLMTDSFFILILWKILIIGLLAAFLIRWYDRPPIHARYLIVVYMILIILAQIEGIRSNISAYNQKPSEVKDIPEEIRAEAYQQKYSPLLSLWIMLFIIFIVWWMIEQEQLRWRITKF